MEDSKVELHPKNHLVWVDPDEFNILLDAIEEVVREMPVVNDKMITALQAFRPEFKL